MTKSAAQPTDPIPNSLTVHLGAESRLDLARCQTLEARFEAPGPVPSLSAIIRTALRRRRLELLRRHADFRLASCPLRDEYFRLLEEADCAASRYRDLPHGSPAVPRPGPSVVPPPEGETGGES